MKYIKLFEKFHNQKWVLSINEGIFDKIESLVKGKSDQGKIVSELLTKNNIEESGTGFSILFVGGAQPGKQELSNPIDYLNYTPGVSKITEEGVLVLDEKSKELKTPDTISFLSQTVSKEEISKNFTYGLKPGSSVNKVDYKFDLSKDVPTVTMTTSMWSMKEQKFILGEEETNELQELFDLTDEEHILSLQAQMPLITLQQWVDKLNQTGWIKEDPDYFKMTLKLNENLSEQSNKELKEFQRELKSLERKKEGLISSGKKLITPSAYAIRNKIELEKVDKGIKEINKKINKLK